MLQNDNQDGFSLVELMVATGALLAVLSVSLTFFARSQNVYTNERSTLDMAQDLRTAFDRFTNEIRMAGGGLPGYHGVVQGSANTLIVRGDFANLSTIVTAQNAGVLTVGTTSGFSAGQTLSLLNTITGSSALTTIASVDSGANTITLSAANLLPITSGAQVSDYGPGTIINVIERRTYSIKTGSDDPDQGAITRATSYESTQVPGTIIKPAEIIARNVLSADGGIGLSFTYLDATDNALAVDPDTGLVDATKVAKVQVGLHARTANKDITTGEYRTLNLTARIEIRGQYIPAVGF